jgi:hypothetical protein
MRIRARLLVVALLSSVVVAACDQGTESEGGLTAAEARAVAVMIDDAATTAVEAETTSAPQLSLAPISGPSHDIWEGTHEFDVGAACPLGGDASVGGDLSIRIDTEAGTIEADLSATSDLAACAFRTEEGEEIEVDGSIGLVAERELSEGSAHGLNVHTGSLDYSTSSGREGTCDIDLTTELTAMENSATKTVTGSVCGHDVTTTTNWTRTG